MLHGNDAQAAQGIAERRNSLEEAAWNLGYRVEVIRWRINITEARRLLAS
ncbi:hypothetical protein ACWEO2_27570 [Nocardia sp. NPDC004278]